MSEQKLPYVWHVTPNVEIKVDYTRALRLAQVPERVSPNPLCTVIMTGDTPEPDLQTKRKRERHVRSMVDKFQDWWNKNRS